MFLYDYDVRQQPKDRKKTKTKQDINRSDKWFATLENCVYC